MTRLPGSSPLAIMTLREVRDAGAAGAGLVAFSPSLDAVLWANAPGRAVLGLSAGESSLSATSVTVRQIKASARLIETWGEARILIRSTVGRTSKAVVATLQRIDSVGLVLLTLPELRPAAATQAAWAASLLADSGLEAAAVYDVGGPLAATAAFQAAGTETIEPALVALLSSGAGLDEFDGPTTRMTLAQVAEGLVLVRQEPLPEVAAPSEAEEVPAEAPAERSFFSVKRRKLSTDRGRMSMNGLLQRWHTRQNSVDAPETAGEEPEAASDVPALSPETEAPETEAPEAVMAVETPVTPLPMIDDKLTAADEPLPDATTIPVRSRWVLDAPAEPIAPAPLSVAELAATAPQGSAENPVPQTENPGETAQPLERESQIILPDIDPEQAETLDVPISDDEEAPAEEPLVPSELEATNSPEPEILDHADDIIASTDVAAEPVADEGERTDDSVVEGAADAATAPLPAETLADLTDAGTASPTADAFQEEVPVAVDQPVAPEDEPAEADPAALDDRAVATAQPLSGEMAVEALEDAAPESGLPDSAEDFAALPVIVENAPQEELPAFDSTPVRSPAFTPRFDMAPVRFVWQIDRDGNFRSLTPEFSAAVGPRAADVAGRSFREVAAVFGFDEGGEIARLLDRRDTWSGRSILWPVEASDRKVPVDLAALPIYARDRSFDGFRGFGIVRMNESVADPEAIGMILSDPPMPAENGVAPLAEQAVAELPLDPAPVRPLLTTYEAPAFGRRPAPPVPDVVPETPGVQPVAGDAPPADMPKVIRLEERRRPREGALSQAEEAAFRAIGMKLGEKSEPIAPKDAPIVADMVERDKTAPGDVAPPVTDDPVDQAGLLVAPEERSDGENAGEGGAVADVIDGADGDAAPVAPAEDPAVAIDAISEDRGVSATDDAVADSSAEAPVAPAAAPSSTSPWASDLVTSADHSPEAALAKPVEAESLEALATPETPAAETPVVADAGGEPMSVDRAEAALDEDGDEADDIDAENPAALAAELEAVFASLPLPVLAEAHGLLLYANREFQDLTGYESIDALEAAGGLDQLFTDPTDPLRTGELAIRRSNGHTVDVRVHMQRATFSGRSCLLMSFTPSPRDAVALIQAPVEASSDTADLRQQVEELQAVLDTATDGVVLLDPAGSIRAMNGSAHALFGVAQDDHSGRHLSTLFAHESQKATLDYLDMLRDDGLAGILNDGREVIGRVAQGGFIPLFITIGRLSGERGWCVVIRDIAHWKRIEEDLVNARRQAEAASLHKSRFLANISHELRTPLNAIIGFADVMASECFGPIGNERYLEYLGDIKRSGHHVLDLVNDLLDISKIEAGKLDLAFEAVSLNEVVSEVVSLMQPQANRERVIVRSNLPSSVPPVVADRRTMRQIALNLVANAIRFTPAGGQIIASTTYTADGDVLLRFRDSGIGMTEREIEIALTPFQQVHAPSANRGEGTGLGLPLTKAMVEANRALFAISSTPNEGTLVEISFPSQRVLAD